MAAGAAVRARVLSAGRRGEGFVRRRSRAVHLLRRPQVRADTFPSRSALGSRSEIIILIYNISVTKQSFHEICCRIFKLYVTMSTIYLRILYYQHVQDF